MVIAHSNSNPIEVKTCQKALEFINDFILFCCFFLLPKIFSIYTDRGTFQSIVANIMILRLGFS